MTLLSFALNLPVVVILQAFIIEKANKSLDFTLTTFFLHLVATWVYSGRFPWSFEWWCFHAALVFATTLVCEFVIMRIEQQEIKLSFDADGLNKIVEQGKEAIK